MKILIIQENGRHEENRHFRECFCLQRSLQALENQVDLWGKGHENEGVLPDFDSYDLIVNLENYDVTDWLPDLSPYTNPVKFLWSIDAHCRGLTPYLNTFVTGKYDLILQATKDYLTEESVWFPNCYDDSLIGKRAAVEKTVALGFCGSMLNRQSLLDGLTSRYTLQQNIWVLGEKMVETINSYWIHFNLNLANDINYRSFETLGCETLLLTNYNPQYDELGFIDEENCLMYRDTLDLQRKLEKYLGEYDIIKPLIANAKDLASKHTYNERAKLLLEIYHDRKK
jgi:hypothetical protein